VTYLCWLCECYQAKARDNRASVRMQKAQKVSIANSARCVLFDSDMMQYDSVSTRMWANAHRDGRPAEYRWRPLLNAAKFG